MKFPKFLFFLTISIMLATSCAPKGGGKPVSDGEIEMDTTLINSVKDIVNSDTVKYQSTGSGTYRITSDVIYIGIYKKNDNESATLKFKKKEVELTERENKEIIKIADAYVRGLKDKEQNDLKKSLINYVKDN